MAYFNAAIKPQLVHIDDVVVVHVNVIRARIVAETQDVFQILRLVQRASNGDSVGNDAVVSSS